MSDSVPSAAEQTPSIDEIFSRFQGLPADQQVPALAAIMQAVIGQVADLDGRFQDYCSRFEDLDKEIHEDFFGPIHDQYVKGMRAKGIEGIKGKYSSKFDELAEPLKAFGIDDIYGRLYDYLEELKKGEGYTPESEGPAVDGIYNQAMERIGMVRGKPAKAEEKPAEKPATEVTVAVEKKPAASIKDKLAAGKRRSMLDGY